MNAIDIRGTRHKDVYHLGEDFTDWDRDGHELGFTNYYMTYDENPVFGISGEFHFSRYSKRFWEQEVLKMKMGGIDIISTYVFWNHHEEVEGCFDFTGRRDLREFVSLCHRHGLWVILRIGPFNHGEVRNGGLPDWLYGKPYQVRHTNAGFMKATYLLYEKIYEQVATLFYHQGGPIIGVQLDNEYMHSCAPWEMTTGVSNEWVPVGDEGETYILALKDMAKAIGIRPAFYTCTAWGGAIAPESVMPLWGGYAYRPWLFYRPRDAHPSTEEYIYQDYHNNDKPIGHDFEPRYLPESKPYACCEMGGGMMCSYNYRFQLPYKSVDAMANIKMASGCNFLGYYVFHGGTNPRTRGYTSLNESQVAKISYDYQAAIGEVGQIRESYQRLKSLHYFAKSVAPLLCRMGTVLPEGASAIEPQDVDTLRYAIRTDGQSGFVFINNFQDHEEAHEKENERISIKTDEGDIEFRGISLAPEENCILPFKMQLGKFMLEKGTAQFISMMQIDQVDTAIFLCPQGMEAKFCFAHLQEPIVADSTKDFQRFELRDGSHILTLILLSRDLSDRMYLVEGKGLIFTDGPLIEQEGIYKVECMKPETRVGTYPITLSGGWKESIADSGFIDDGAINWGILRNNTISFPLAVETVGPHRYSVNVPVDAFDTRGEYALVVDYEGDMGQAFIRGACIHDQFYNGDLWYIPLEEYRNQLRHEPLTLYITPIKKGVHIQVDTSMAGRHETVEQEQAMLHSVRLDAYYWEVLNIEG